MACNLPMHRPCQLCYIRANYFHGPCVTFLQDVPASSWKRFRGICINCIAKCQAIRRTQHKQKQCQTMFNWHTHAHFQNICDNLATLLHNCHTVARAQHCRTIVTVMFRQQCCKIVTLPGCSRFVPIVQFCSRFVFDLLLFTFCSPGPLLFLFCSTFVFNLGQNRNKAKTRPPQWWSIVL